VELNEGDYQMTVIDNVSTSPDHEMELTRHAITKTSLISTDVASGLGTH